MPDNDDVIPVGTMNYTPPNEPKKSNDPQFSRHDFADQTMPQDQIQLDRYIGSLKDTTLQNEMDEVIYDLIQKVQQGSSPEEIQTILASQDGLSTDELEKKLSRIFFMADVMGRLNAQNEPEI